MATNRVILVGMMGSGKSAVGRSLAALAGWPYIDNDDVLRRADGMTAREMAEERGEAGLRDAESRALATALGTPPPCIVGAAAGTVLDPASRERMRDAGKVVWLRARADTLQQRSAGGDHRPWVGEAGGDWIRKTLDEREPLYESVAALTVDVDDRSPDEAAALIRERLGI